MTEVEVSDLKTLRQKYLKRKLDPNKFGKEVEVFFNHNTGILELEITYLMKWSGDEYKYFLVIHLDSDSVIQKIPAPKCQRLVGDDALGSDYRGKRADDFDYHVMDTVLSYALV